MKGISYVLTTRNRPLFVMEWLKAVYPYCEKYNIEIIVMDGGDDNSLSKCKINFPEIIYHYEPNKDMYDRSVYGVSLATRSHVCMIGDTQIPVIEEISYIINLLEKNYDLINLSYRDMKKIGMKEYDKIEEMFRDNVWDMTLYGSVFFKRESYNVQKLIDINGKRVHRSNDFFSQLDIYFDCFENSKSFKGLYENRRIIVINSKNKTNNWNTFEVFFKDYTDTILNLDCKYDKYKASAIKDHGKYSSLKLNNPYRYLLMRALGNLNSRIVKKYKYYIKKCTDLPYIFIYLISLIPQSFLILAKNFIKR